LQKYSFQGHDAELQLKHFLLHAALLASVGLLVQGCAPLAPGFRSASNDAAQAVSPAGFSTAEIDPPPAGALTEINPTLIAAHRAAIRQTKLSPEVMALIGSVGPYRIGPGDVIGIVVFGHPEIEFSASSPPGGGVDGASVSPAPGFIVSSTGFLSFPYVGSLKADGMTVQELEDVLVKRLSRVYKNPQLFVRIQAFRSKRAFMDGEVRTPGLMLFSDIPMTLAEALNRAGGLTANGDRSAINLTRDGKTIPIDLMAMADAGIDPSRIPLRPGDLIYARGRDERKVTVMGETTAQTGVLMRNGQLSLTDALTEVAGLNLTTANPRQIYVIRNEAQGQSIFHLDARTPTAIAMAQGFPLKAKDVVYVDPVPLVQWNRVLNLILPTATTAITYQSVGTTATGR
jgi:polysaccharide export outer membrane protein